MKKLIGLGICICIFALFATAQEGPKPELFAGYQYTHLDGGWHGNGWDSAATMPLGHWFGVSGDFSGGYGSGSSLYTYTFGPQVSTHTKSIAPFAHALFGGAHASSNGLGSNGMAMFFGGGVDAGHQSIAFRLVQFDWMITRFSGVSDKNNVRVSTGLLLRF